MSAIRVAVCVLCCAVIAAGCGPSQSPAAKEKVIGAALLTQTHVFFQDMVAAMKSEAEKQGFKLRVQYAEFDSRKQIDQMETFIAQGVDAIIVSPADSSGLNPVIAEARAKNIPVFTADIAAHGAQVVSHIASDNEHGGVIIAEYLAKLLNGKGKVAIIDHPTVASAQDRVRGFEQTMAKFPEIQIVGKVPGEGQRDKAMRAAQDILQAHADLNGIFGINDDSALGALAAVEAAGLQDKVKIVGFDGTPEAKAAIAAGKALKADAVQYPDKIGQKTIDVIAAHFRGETVPSLAPVEVGLMDAESLKQK